MPRLCEKTRVTAVMATWSAERFAVQRSGRRQAGAAILRRCLCGDQIRCNGLFDSATGTTFK